MTTGGPLDSRPKYNVVINCYVIFVSLGIYCDILDNWILIPEMTRVKIFKMIFILFVSLHKMKNC